MSEVKFNRHRGYEMSPYSLDPDFNGDGYEKRIYPSLQWVSTTAVPGKRGLGGPFRKLFNYITGTNEQGAKISMTTPVLMKFDGSEDQPTSRIKPYQMSFYTPEEYHDKAPQPTDSDVFLSATPGMTVYVRTYGGWTSEEKEKRELQTLEDKLQKDGISYPKGKFYVAGYDSPFRLWGAQKRDMDIGGMKNTDPSIVKLLPEIFIIFVHFLMLYIYKREIYIFVESAPPMRDSYTGHS